MEDEFNVIGGFEDEDHLEYPLYVVSIKSEFKGEKVQIGNISS